MEIVSDVIARDIDLFEGNRDDLRIDSFLFISAIIVKGCLIFISIIRDSKYIPSIF